MSLRFRLSLLFTGLWGWVLLVFGTLVYIIISTVMVGQIDARLYQTSNQIIELLQVNSKNQFDTRSITGYQPTDIVIFQVWDEDRNLQFSRPTGWTEPLNDAGLHLGQSFYSTQVINGTQLRVLSIPLTTNRSPVGFLQVGQSTALIETTQRTLASVILILAVVLMGLVGIGTWILTGEALSQLTAATAVAATIAQADDLSRRIPVITSHNDEVGQLVTAFNDILARLERLFNTERRFLADVSHELRTPLTVIKGEVGLMRLTGSLDDESLSNIEKEVDRLTRLVGDLLTLEQAETGQLPLDMQPLALDTVLLDVFHQMGTLAAGKVQLILDDIDQIQVLGDRDRLKQVILNLISNAIQYTPAGGTVHVALSKEAGQAVLKVKDSGPGISAEDLPHIFERFFRAERSRKRKGSGGFGLGLSITQWIVTRHSGTIEVTSTPGEGSCFLVRIPLHGAAQALPPAEDDN